jgi:hypothetical protein
MLAYLFVIFAVLARMPFMPHPWNLTPVAAALLYFGARRPRRQLWVPFALLAASEHGMRRFSCSGRGCGKIRIGCEWVGRLWRVPYRFS